MLLNNSRCFSGWHLFQTKTKARFRIMPSKTLTHTSEDFEGPKKEKNLVFGRSAPSRGTERRRSPLKVHGIRNAEPTARISLTFTSPLPHFRVTVDGINLATPRAPRGPKFHKFRFFVVLRVPGGPGAITNRRGMKKHARSLIFVNFGWIYEGFVPNFDF